MHWLQQWEWRWMSNIIEGNLIRTSINKSFYFQVKVTPFFGFASSIFSWSRCHQQSDVARPAGVNTAPGWANTRQDWNMCVSMSRRCHSFANPVNTKLLLKARSKPTTGGVEDAVKYTQGIRLIDNLSKLSEEESLRHWKSREGIRDHSSIEGDSSARGRYRTRVALRRRLRERKRSRDLHHHPRGRTRWP